MENTLQTRPVSTIKAQAVACLSAVAQSMRMNPFESAEFLAHPVAMSIALAPIVAGCVDAVRSAMAMLTLYVAANRGEVRKAFDHSPADNQGAHRFALAEALMRGGDEAIKRAFVARWELVTVYGHQRDLEKDIAAGEYNPLTWGGWDLEGKVAELSPDARFGEVPELDEVLPQHIVEKGFW